MLIERPDFYRISKDFVMLPAIKGMAPCAGLAACAAVAPAQAAAPAGPDARIAPEFAGIDTWLNSPPLTLAQLRGKVVLVDFWTFACGNCVNTLPAVNAWHRKYGERGLVVVGVHTPEFPFEHDTGNVQRAIERFGITYPVAQDNRYATWAAYRNQYWPAFYLIDKQGRVAYTHVGEGDYARTEAAIAALLAQP